LGVADPDADEHGKTLEAALAPKRARPKIKSTQENDF
jgi:hypothetical protein